MSVASLKQEAEREHALAAIGGQQLPPWVLGTGGTSDLIRWSGYAGDTSVSWPVRGAVLRHMRLGDRVRVARKLIPEWVLSKVQDHTQLDGIAVLEHCDDDGIVYLRLSGLGLPFRAGNPWMENGPVFAIGEQVFVVSAYHGEIVDAE